MTSRSLGFTVRLLVFAAVAAPIVSITPSFASAQEESSAVKRLDPRLGELVDMDAKVEQVVSDFGFIEGPVWVPDPEGGYLLFSDIPGNRVLRLDAGDRVTVAVDPVTPDGSPAGGVGGSNGLALDPSGRLILCEHGNRRVARLEADGTRTTLAERLGSKRLNSPNDIVFHPRGWAYFTDPAYGLGPGEKGRELDWNGIYRLRFDDAGEPAGVDLLNGEMANPNGIGLSPDGQTLYVANSNISQRLWMAFPVAEDGTLEKGRVFFDGSALPAPGVPDGFAVDELGNLWASGPGGIVVISPAGDHLGTISVPELPANAGFGGASGRTLYITARKSLYRVPLRVRGLSFDG